MPMFSVPFSGILITSKHLTVLTDDEFANSIADTWHLWVKIKKKFKLLFPYPLLYHLWVLQKPNVKNWSFDIIPLFRAWIFTKANDLHKSHCSLSVGCLVSI